MNPNFRPASQPSSLLIATHNPGKRQEILALLQDLEVRLFTPDELGLKLSIEEKGETYAQNAALKAIAFARAVGMVSLADDTGLEVEALNGLPGIHSARLVASPQATDAQRRKALLERLEGKPRPWKAHFRCVVAIATPVGEVFFFEGVCPGEIIPQQRGSHGFGYDPIFLLPLIGRTMAELDLAQKNEISHRAMAVHAAKPKLKELLGL